MRFDLDHLRVFYEVAKAGSFTKAAEVMNISQPSVSRTIQLLEDRLGVILFERQARGLKLTLDGERLLVFAQRFIEEARQLESFFSDKHNEPSGELKIITSPGVAETWLAAYIPGFLEQFPNISLNIIGRTDRIELEEADVAIRAFVPHHPELVQRRLTTSPIKLWASQEYLDKNGTPERAEDLSDHRLLTFGEETTNVYANLNWILEVGVSLDYRRTPYLKINSLEGLTNLAQAGIGIVELPEEHVKIKKTNLVPILPDLPGPKIELFYIYPERMKKSKRVTCLGDYLEEKLSTQQG